MNDYGITLTIRAVASIQAVQVGAETLFFKRAGGGAATDTVSVDKAIFTSIRYKTQHNSV